MSFFDWIIVIVPVCIVLGMGFYTRRFIRDVADFLTAGRICGRYVLCVADVANALSIIGLVSYVEIHYKTGFALTFWQNLMLPVTMFLGLTGFCVYRFRETKAMSIGQFLEMRYSRSFRIFAATLRSLSEMLANMIMPAIAARFFIYFLDLPHSINLFGFTVDTFMVIVLLVLIVAISIICMGGTLALVVTDSLQGLFLYPLLVLFVVYILCKFSWSHEIVPTMMNRVTGESFLNPYDIDNLRDFNIYYLIIIIYSSVAHRASWIGNGNSSAAKSPHEQKMAGILGTWRGALGIVFYVLVAITIITVMNHPDFTEKAHDIRVQLTSDIALELPISENSRRELVESVKTLPADSPATDRPLSEKSNCDTPYLESAKQVLADNDEDASTFQQFRTLYHQLTMAMTMRNLLPPGMMGLFCLLLVLAMISTDDSRIFSAALTISQDVVLPLRKKAITPREHVWMVRTVAIGVGVFFLIGSSFMSQLDYIQLFVSIMTSMWLGGCAPVMVLGLYSRFGTTAGAWTALITGMSASCGVIFVQRNWADLVYPWLENIGAVETVGKILTLVSKPFHPYIVWEMNPFKCPINSYEFYGLISLTAWSLYIIVSLCTCKRPFNLDRMLHRGKYNLDGDNKTRSSWTLRTIFTKLIGITPDYSTSDKCIAWGVFCYSFIYKFGLAFILVVIWNGISPWPLEWWGHYFFVATLCIPATVALFTTFWFGFGSIRDLRRMFRDLRLRVANPLDDGRVDGHVSLADKAAMEKLDDDSSKNAKQS